MTGRATTAGNDPPAGVLASLCVTVTVSYGSLYYAFAVLGPAISGRESWSLAAMTAGFSAASLVTGGIGVWVGRIIQRRGPRGVMVAGALVGAAGLAGMATSPTLPWFLAAMLVCGAASAGLFYPPAFAAITYWYGDQRVRALTGLTLVAGFASTIFAPLTTGLTDLVGWRWTYLILAGGLLAAVLPLHTYGLAHPWRHEHADAHLQADAAILRSRTFVLVAASGTLVMLAEYASLVGLVPLLVGRGMSASVAAWVLGVGGAGQVVGRLFYPWLTRATGVRGRAVLVAILVALSIAALAAVPGPAAVLLALSVAAGLGRGLFTLVGATLVSEVWGPDRYAALNGVLSAPLTAAGALGPFAGAVVASLLGGYPQMFAAMAALGLLGAVLMGVALRGSSTSPQPSFTTTRVADDSAARDAQPLE